jgi:hypothetical protein
MWQTPDRHDHLTGTSQASANSSKLWNRLSHGTDSALLVKVTFGPVPRESAGWCGALKAVLAIPGVTDDPAPNVSE